MKRFWVFVIICVVALGTGFTVFRFMTKEEIINVNQSVYEVNIGENILLDIEKKNLKPGTEVHLDIQNPNILSKTEDEGYNFKAIKGGATTIIVTSNLKTFVPVIIQVTVGDGNSATPFLIKNQEQLEKIGKTTNLENGESLTYPLSSYYKLTTDIALTGSWTPIGDGSNSGFTGHFDFADKTISNVSVEGEFNCAGLFSKIGVNGYIYNAKLESVSITSSTLYAGAIAGENNGTIEKAQVKNVTITNSNANSFVGGIIGLNKGLITKSQIFDSTVTSTGNSSFVGGLAGASNLVSVGSNTMINRSSAECVISTTNATAVGGLVGSITSSSIENCYAGNIDKACTITAGQNSWVGGITGICQYSVVSSKRIGANVADTYSVMKYINANPSKCGEIIGISINDGSNVESYNKIFGNYYKLDNASSIKGLASAQPNPDTDPNAAVVEKPGIYSESLEKLKMQSTYKSTETLDWQFNEGVWTISANELPKLSFIVNYVSSRIQNYTASNIIKSETFVSTLSNPDPTVTYIIVDDIYLSGDNYKPFDFNGRLTCTKLDSSGKPTVKIHLTLSKEDNVNEGCAAVFKTLGPNAYLTNIFVDINISGMTNAHHVAALAAYNKGVVENCYAENSVTTDLSSDTLFIAGLIAENSGKIIKSGSSVAVKYSNASTTVYAGGITGHNSNLLQNCSNSGKITINGNRKSATGYIGGVVGYTTSEVNTCANHGEVEGQIEASSAYYGGVAGCVGNESDATVKNCANYANVTGSNIGGIAGISMNSIEYCYVGNVVLSGKYVGGLVYSIKRGYLKNSMTDLTNIDAKAVGCGVVYQIDVTQGHNAYCQYIFSSCEFISASAENYYESASNIRGDSSNIWNLRSAIDFHAFDNCIHVARSGSIKRSRFDKALDSSWMGGTSGVEDIEISDAQATGDDGAYQIFRDNGFSSNYWLYNPDTVGTYVRVKNVAL